MALSPFDTIVAPVTGDQPAAVAWVRLSGPESWTIAGKVFRNWPTLPVSHHAVFGTYLHGDSGLALPFEEGHSFTGEQSVELSLHGSTASVRELVERCRNHGARLAEPGEFTLRAFLNGRIDLTQAEAVRDTVEAQTDAQLRAANLNRKGLLRNELRAIRERVLSLIAAVEASVDFSEEVGELDRTAARGEIGELIDQLQHLIDGAEAGKVLRNGLRVAIVGPPNAGKSSLLNAFLGEERAIVTPVAGTTRDYVEELLEIRGFPVVLIDTAGLRATEDPVESIGIERTRTIAANADAVWYLYDAGIGWTDSDRDAVSAMTRPVTVVANKCDLAAPSVGIGVSALAHLGLEALKDSLMSLFQNSKNDRPLINLRHRPLLEAARDALLEAVQALAGDAPDDLVSVLLTDSAMQLGQVTGETAMPDMIERIFHDFCIGK